MDRPRTAHDGTAAPGGDGPGGDAPDAAGGKGPLAGFTPLRVLGVTVMLGVAVFWIWIFSGAARRQNPDYLQDREWVERAEATCAVVQEGIDARSAQGDRTPEQRADDIDTSSAELRGMLDDLAAPLPGPQEDRAVVEPWLADWQQLLSDRDTYATAIRVNPDARFLTVEKFNDPLDTVIKIFADVNDMPSCGPAGDVG